MVLLRHPALVSFGCQKVHLKSRGNRAGRTVESVENPVPPVALCAAHETSPLGAPEGSGLICVCAGWRSSGCHQVRSPEHHLPETRINQLIHMTLSFIQDNMLIPRRPEAKDERHKFHIPLRARGASLVAQLVKNPPTMRETWVQSLGWEDPLEKGMATHSSILDWRSPWISPWSCKKLDMTEQLSLFHYRGKAGTRQP